MEILQKPSPNFSKRNGDGKIKRIVLHYTTSRNAEGSISWLCNPESGVSAHYVVSQQGKVTQLVKDEFKAWHASAANSDSIGIECSAAKGDSLTSAQDAALVDLLKLLMKRHNLNPEAITAHRFTGSNTDCPGDLWPTENDLKSWVRNSLLVVQKPVTHILKFPTFGPEVVKLHQKLATLDFLGIGTHGNLFTKETKKAVMWLQRTHGLVADGIVGPKTQKVIDFLLAENVNVKSSHITLSDSKEKQANGLRILKMECGSIAFNVTSGQPNKQTLRLPSDPSSFPGCMEPLPQGTYKFGVEEWGGEVGDYTKDITPGLGPVFLPLWATFADDRGTFGIHLDGNQKTASGSAGCIVFDRLDKLDQFRRWYATNKPKFLLVDWGLV